METKPIISIRVESIEFETQLEVCRWLETERNNIHKVISIGPNLHANRYLIFYERYTEKLSLYLTKKQKRKQKHKNKKESS